MHIAPPMFTPLPSRALIRLEGEEARSFLQGLVTQNVEGLSTGQAVFAALLTPQGKILFDFFVIGADNGVWLDCHTDMQAALIKRLKMYRLRAKIEIEPMPDKYVGVLFNPNEQGTLPPIPSIETNAAFPDPRLANLGVRIIAGEETLNSLQATKGTPQDYRAHRIANGVAEMGARSNVSDEPAPGEEDADFSSDEIFLMDVNYDAINGVDYQKGCFVGQEVASRMKRKGAVRKRTLIVDYNAKGDHPLQTPSLPQKGDDIMCGETVIGQVISSSARNALAIIRLDRLEKARKTTNALTINDAPINLITPAYLE